MAEIELSPGLMATLTEYVEMWNSANPDEPTTISAEVEAAVVEYLAGFYEALREYEAGRDLDDDDEADD